MTCPSAKRCSLDQQAFLINSCPSHTTTERETLEMAFAIPFPSVANNGTGETEAVVSHPFLPAPMVKVRSQCGANEDPMCDVEPMIGELMSTNPALTRTLNIREKGSQRCVVATQRAVNLLLKTDPSQHENWRFLGSFLNKMGGMYNIIVARKASMLCPFKFLNEDGNNYEVATLDTVMLHYRKEISQKQRDIPGICVRILPPGEEPKGVGPDDRLVPIGTVMFPPVRACGKPLVTLLGGQSEDPFTTDRMTKLPILVVELGTYV